MTKHLTLLLFILPLVAGAQQQPPKPQPNTNIPIIIPITPRNEPNIAPRPALPPPKTGIQVPKPKISGARPNPTITPSASAPWVSESLDLTGWSKVSTPAAGLTFHMPKEPTELKRNITAGDRELELMQYVYSMGDAGAYVVTISGLPEDQSASSDAVLRSARERVLQTLRGRLLRENTVEVGNATGTELVIMTPGNTVVRQRMFVNGGQFLQAIAAGPADFVISAETDKYFRALRFEVSDMN